MVSVWCPCGWEFGCCRITVVVAAMVAGDVRSLGLRAVSQRVTVLGIGRWGYVLRGAGEHEKRFGEVEGSPPELGLFGSSVV